MPIYILGIGDVPIYSDSKFRHHINTFRCYSNTYSVDIGLGLGLKPREPEPRETEGTLAGA